MHTHLRSLHLALFLNAALVLVSLLVPLRLRSNALASPLAPTVPLRAVPASLHPHPDG